MINIEKDIATSDHLVGIGKSSGTFGELLQGVLYENNYNFLVTLPISNFSEATFKSVSVLNDILVFPSHKQKSKLLAQKLLLKLGLPLGGVLEINSNLPEGKGLASSSADLVATYRAIKNCFNIETEMSTLQGLISEIEPTDGVMYDGVISFYHKKVELRDFLGYMPPICILSIDEGGIVDTIEFNKINRYFSSEEKKEYDCLLNELSIAIKKKGYYGNWAHFYKKCNTKSKVSSEKRII